MLPVLLGRPPNEPVRKYLMQQTNSLALAIRTGRWKYLDHKGSGGNNYDGAALKPFALPDTAPMRQASCMILKPTRAKLAICTSSTRTSWPS